MPKPDPIIVQGQCKGGKLEWTVAWKFIKAAITRWPDGPVELTLAVKEDTRRARANRWLFGVVYRLMLCEQEGRVTEAGKLELHETMAYRFNPVTVIDPVTKEERLTGGPTHKMGVERFGQFIEDVMLLGSEHFGIVWPEPRKDEDWRASAK